MSGRSSPSLICLPRPGIRLDECFGLSLDFVPLKSRAFSSIAHCKLRQATPGASIPQDALRKSSRPRRPRTPGPPVRASMTSQSSHYSTGTPKAKKPPAEPRPSSSIVLLSPTNQVLLLHRVQTSSAFPSAHVFPGGNLSELHDGAVHPPGDAARHADSLPYRIGAIRETFEESGILLARGKGSASSALLNLPSVERNRARKAIYGNEVRFTQWLDNVGGVADTESLIPFTRWITPPATTKRFTTQMYLYMLPLSTPVSADPVLAAAQSEAALPTPDGSEVTTTAFDDVYSWMQRQKTGDIILFPPQAFLLSLMRQFCTGPPSELMEDPTLHYEAQREELMNFLNTTPTATHPKAVTQPASHIPWGEKVISPVTTMMAGDGRVVLSLDKPGPELKGSGRGGEWEKVVLVKFEKGGPRGVEIRDREEVFEAERQRRKREEEEEKKKKKKKGNGNGAKL